MGQGIQDFYTAAQTYGFARDHQLRVSQIGNILSSNPNLLVYAKSASLPKRSIGLGTVYYKGFELNATFMPKYDSGAWPLSLYCDQAYIIKTQLELWQKSTFDEHSMQGDLANNIIELKLLNDNTDVLMTYRLHGCIPQSVSDIKYDLGGTGTPQSIDLTIAYQYWTSTQS